MSKCKHGLGKFCAVCNGTVRAITQAKPPSTPRQVSIPKRNIKSTPPLFINGTPYVPCGHCGIATKKFDGSGDRFGHRDKYIKIDLERKILVGEFVPDGEEYTVDTGGFTVLKRRSKLVLMSVAGCFECWNQQQAETLNQKYLEENVEGHKAHAVFFKRTRS